MELSAIQSDILKELLNIGVGRAASMLNRILRCHISLQIPRISVVSGDGLLEYKGSYRDTSMTSVELAYEGAFSGVATLLFPSDSANRLVSLILNESGGEMDLDLLRIGTLEEVGNIVLNGVLGSISNILKEHLNYSPPVYEEGTFESLVLSKCCNADSAILVAQTHFLVEQVDIAGEIVLIFEMRAFRSILAIIDKIFSGMGA